jgi:hypothetical protein
MKVRVKNAPKSHWYAGMEGKEFEVIGKSDEHEAWLVEVPKYTGRFIYYVDCEPVVLFKIVLKKTKTPLDELYLTVGKEYDVVGISNGDNYVVLNDMGAEFFISMDMIDVTAGNKPLKVTIIDSHYDNSNGSLYKFAEDHGLNAYEFETIKRVVRSRKKGEFISDIEKTIRVLNLYLEEQKHKYEGQYEQLNDKL